MVRHALSNHQEVVDTWADQIRHGPYEGGRGYGCNMSFEGDRLYSYAAEIARILTSDLGDRMAAITPRQWSISTSCHQSKARRAIDYEYLDMEDFDDPIGERDRHVKIREIVIYTQVFSRHWPEARFGDKEIRRIEKFFGLDPVQLAEPGVKEEEVDLPDGSTYTRQSVSFRDRRACFVDNMRVPKWFWEGKITPSRVLGTTNAEVRRVAVATYGGWEGFIAACKGSEMVHRDDFGELWSIPARKEPGGYLVLVKVVNSTPEPDGTFKDYFLRIDPYCRPLGDWGPIGEPQELTARNAVASTFGLRGEDYTAVEES